MRRIVGLVSAMALALIVSLGAQTATRPAAAFKRGPDARRLLGTWRTLSPNSVGFIHYDNTGHYGVQIMNTSAPRRPFGGGPTGFAVGTGNEPTCEEAKEALRTYTAYFGTYTVDERAKTVTHHRTGHTNPGAVGDYVRKYEFLPGDRLDLMPIEYAVPRRVNWERIKPLGDDGK